MNVRQRALSSLALCMMAVSLMPPPASAGGWAVATLDELPSGVAAGEEFAIAFAMRQHGVQLANWGEIPLRFTHLESQREITVVAPADAATMKYTVRVILPQAGLWRWSAGDGFIQPMGTIAVTPWPESIGTWTISGVEHSKVIAAAPDAQQGRELFLAKGCVVCHSHSAVAAVRAETLGEFASFTTGPDLTDFSVVPEYLRLWLADPRSVRPDAQMPDLELDDHEIEALIEFLDTE